MFLRMAVLQFRYAIPDQMLEARETLAQRVEGFEREMDAMSAAISGFRARAIAESETMLSQWNSNAQKLQTSIEVSSNTALTTLKASIDDVSVQIGAAAEASRQASAAMTSVTRSTTSLLRRLESNQDGWASALEKSLENTTAGMRDLVQRIQAVDVPENGFEVGLARVFLPLAAPVENAQTALVTFEEHVRGIKISSDALTAPFEAAIQPLSDSLRAFSAAATAIETQLRAVIVRPEVVETAVANAFEPVVNKARAVAESMNSLNEQLRRVAIPDGELSSRIGEALSAFTNGISATERAVRALSHELNRLEAVPPSGRAPVSPAATDQAPQNIAGDSASVAITVGNARQSTV
jgi:hypothetical protein